MADAADDRELVSKSVSPVGPSAMPPRPGEAIRRLADPTYQLKPDQDGSCLSVGRGITLSGEVNSCDKLFIEGSVDAKLTNCRAIEVAESGLFKGSTLIDEAEIRGRFEGDLTVRNRLLIKATGRVAGTIRYGQIEIECGGQIFGDIQAPRAGESAKVAAGADAASPVAHPASTPDGSPPSVPGDRSSIH
jgi:cytoskeletal protein CcmA (bactofilin family)